MIRITLLTLVTFFVFLGCSRAQNFSIIAGNDYDIITEQLFTLSNPKAELLKTHVREATFLRLDQTPLRKLAVERPEQLRLQIPTNEGTFWTLELTQSEIFTDDFYADTQTEEVIDYKAGLYYHGYLRGDEKSMVAITLFEDKVYGFIVTDGETYVLGHLKQNVFPTSKEYILYKASDLLIQNNSECATDELPTIDPPKFNPEATEKNTGCKIIKIYFEADYRMYLDNGSNEQETLNFVTAMFNVVALLYKNEELNIRISKTRVWTNNDNYPTNSSTNALYAFRSRLGGSFQGDIAHLLSTVPNNNGGVAFVGVLCVPGYAVSYSNIRNNFSDFPTYSWTIEVVTHELGHNFGSPHTHSCSWPGGPIDNCYLPEGTCSRGPAPQNGGTIMSYCHLTSTGINFQKGFGPLPGNLIRSKTESASCLETIDGDCNDGDNGGGGGNGGFGEPNLTRSGNSLSANGLKVNANVIVKNVGEGRSVPCQLGFYLSLDNSFSDADVLVDTKPIPRMASGEIYGVVGNFDLSTLNLPPGNYYLGYIIDNANEVEESDEQDNTWYWINPRFLVTEDDSDNGGGNGGGGNGGGGDTDYCGSKGEDVKYEWIAKVEVGDLLNETGRNSGYGDFTEMETKLQRGSQPAVKLTPGYRNQNYAEYWMIWIDFNKDKDFDDAGELVFGSDAPSKREVSGNLNIPGDAPMGKTRMRVSMKWFDEDEQAQRSCSNFGYGEVEDYTVEIVGEVTNYCAINNVTAGDQTDCDPLTATYDQDLRLSYAGNPNTIVAKVGSQSFRFDATGSPQHILLDGLAADGMPVNVEMELSSGDGCETNETFERLFVAAEACEATCEVPLPLGVNEISPSEVSILWETQQFAEYFQVRYRAAGEIEWQYETSNSSNVNVSGLEENTTYEYQIRANCASIGWSDWSEIYVFVTKGGCRIVTPRSVDIQNGSTVEIRWYPVPSAVGYSLRYRPFGASEWESELTENTTITLNNLESSIVYEYQLAAKCTSGWSGWSALYSFFTIGGLAGNGNGVQALDSELSVQLYPNPTRSQLHLKLSNAGQYFVSISDTNGKIVQQAIVYDNENQLDVTALKTGVYFVKVQSEAGYVSVERLVKY